MFAPQVEERRCGWSWYIGREVEKQATERGGGGREGVAEQGSGRGNAE